MSIKAKIEAAEQRVNAASKTFKDFDSWSEAAKEAGYKVKKVTVSNLNTYYQAISSKGVVGFFNTREGKKGTDPSSAPGGNLDVKKPLRSTLKVNSAMSDIESLDPTLQKLARQFQSITSSIPEHILPLTDDGGLGDGMKIVFGGPSTSIEMDGVHGFGSKRDLTKMADFFEKAEAAGYKAFLSAAEDGYFEVMVLEN